MPLLSGSGKILIVARFAENRVEGTHPLPRTLFRCENAPLVRIDRDSHLAIIITTHFGRKSYAMRFGQAALNSWGGVLATPEGHDRHDRVRGRGEQLPTRPSPTAPPAGPARRPAAPTVPWPGAAPDGRHGRPPTARTPSRTTRRVRTPNRSPDTMAPAACADSTTAATPTSQRVRRRSVTPYIGTPSAAEPTKLSGPGHRPVSMNEAESAARGRGPLQREVRRRSP